MNKTFFSPKKPNLITKKKDGHRGDKGTLRLQF